MRRKIELAFLVVLVTYGRQLQFELLQLELTVHEIKVQQIEIRKILGPYMYAFLVRIKANIRYIF